MVPEDRAERTRHVNRVRRTFTHRQRISKVGYVGDELHRTSCPDFQAALRRTADQAFAIYLGNLELALTALLDDFVDGLVQFPALHDCLRTDPDPRLN